MTIRILFSLALVAMLTGSCRTVDDSQMTSSAIVKPTVITGSVELGKALSEVLYLQLLNIEIGSGIKVPSKRLHSSRGLLQCHSDGILKTCYVRARLVGDALSKRESAESDIIRAFWTHTAQTRPSVINDQQLVADVVCDYVGPKSPPYNMEQVSCRVEHVRHSDEIVLSGPQAAVVAESIRGNQVTTPNAKTSLLGTVLCRSLSRVSSTCLTRGYVDEQLSADIRELGSSAANSLHKTIMQTHQDHALLTAGGKRVVYLRPDEVLSDVRCFIDLSNPQFFGGYVCRMNI